MKRGILILIGVGIVTIIIIALSIFFFFQRSQTPGTLQGEDPFKIDTGNAVPPIETITEGTDIKNIEGGGALIRNTLIKISDGPVASAFVRGFTEKVSTTTNTGATTTIDVYKIEVRYVDKDTGHINSFLPSTGEKPRLSNTTIPGVQDATWLQNGTSLAIRTTNTKDIFLGTLFSSDSTLRGAYLGTDVVEVVPYSSSTIAEMVENGSGVLVREASIAGAPIKDLFRSSLRDATLLGTSFRTLSFTSKPSSTLFGTGYLFTGTSGLFKRIANTKGLTLLSHPQGGWVLVGNSNNKTIEMRAYRQDTESFVSLPLSTLPEKCVWQESRIGVYCAVPKITPSAVYPDDWYQGKISFEDQLWELNIEKGQGKLLRNFTAPFDIIGMSLDPKGIYMTFINKRDNSLWGLSI